MRPIRLFVVDHIPAKPENLLTHFFFGVLNELYKLDPSVIREFLSHAGVQEAAGWGTDDVEILWRAKFTVEVTDDTASLLVRGRTGKFVPRSYAEGTGSWREICKGRIVSVNEVEGIAEGEVYVGASSPRRELERALQELSEFDYLEIDQYGAASKVLSALTEYYFTKLARDAGYVVKRMPEDMAKHLGSYPNYDFELIKDGVTKKVELKSLWGTDTDYARLIHTKNKRYPTSSCKFSTQDIFAVNLFLRTGNIRDFAFARSVPRDEKPYGLPRAKNHPDHVHQNPRCTPGDGTWFTKLDDVWALE